MTGFNYFVRNTDPISNDKYDPIKANNDANSMLIRNGGYISPNNFVRSNVLPSSKTRSSNFNSNSNSNSNQVSNNYFSNERNSLNLNTSLHNKKNRKNSGKRNNKEFNRRKTEHGLINLGN